ncbi:PREDICTED: uncharacterized protein LOC109339759 isoform X2 [Lupinus angustifolius]|uniref:uncharacterized protein LOC109339759 isoform X2 n=1 Tax=Lupinus angustifolius TaxID=3871 RepID=UPI00092E867E|nr:PREDICTED: uncharacterized protein LOC109339759 isoform X2 [Lupinus angustifolius]
MALVEMKKCVVIMSIMTMLVLAHADHIASSPQDDQKIQPESKLTCGFLCPIKCNPIDKDPISFGSCLIRCIKRCKKVLSMVDINHCIAKHRATSFSGLKDVNDRDGVDAYVNSFLEDCKSK